MLPVLALIPMMTNEVDARQQQRRRLVMSCVVGALMLIFAAAVMAWKLDAARWVR
jgi:hypothetical protein